MRKYRSVLLLLCALLFGCGRAETVVETASVLPSVQPAQSVPSAEKHSRTVFAMDTVMELTVYSADEEVLEKSAEKIAELESKLSVTLPDSEIHTLNTDGHAVLSADTAFLLASAQNVCESTGGALDITVYPVVCAWGFTTGDYRIPSDEELTALLAHVDSASILLDGPNASLPEGTAVDLGSVAKGYTGDVLCGLLEENGVTSALLNLGGNVQALGSKPDGSPWRIAVRHPTDAENYLGVLEISDMAAITSGSYERYFTGEDGRKYWHILDPATGKPADSGLLSVTVVGESGLLCDALSTALFVMGPDRAAEYWRTHAEEEFEVIFVTEDGGISITEGLRGCFVLSEAFADMGFTVIER
ncbi:MAG: FAD:protein FMN transferase [Eubacteriales bacterium]